MTLATGTQKEVDAAGDFVNLVKLTSTEAIAFYSEGSSGGIFAKHLTLNSDNTIDTGAKLTIEAGVTSSGLFKGTRLTNTSALFCYFYGSTHRAVVITVSGTTLTKNTVKNLTDTTISFNTLDRIISTKAIYCYSDASNNGKARILTTSGSSPTIAVTEGSSFQYDATGAYNNAVVGLASNRAVVTFVDANDSDTIHSQIMNVSGSTITLNSAQQISAKFGTQQNTHDLHAVKMSSSKYVVVWIDETTGSPNAIIQSIAVTISGANFNEIGTVVAITTGDAFFEQISVSANNPGRFTVAAAFTSSQMVVNTMGISGNTDLFGGDSVGLATDTPDDGWVVAQDSTNSIVLWIDTTGTDSVQAIQVSTPFIGYDLIKSGGGLPF